MSIFVNTGEQLIRRDLIETVDLVDIEEGYLRLHAKGRIHILTGTHAIEALMILKPSALESRRLNWQKHAWAIHNLLGHPLMQLLAFLRCYKLAIRVHDTTVPRPIGFKNQRTNPA